MNKLDIPFYSDLIYDVGMNEGEDTEFYLASGFRVLAIDADPDLVNKARVRFASEVESGRLTLLNVGLSHQASVEKFWICEPNSNWNSFEKSLAARNGAAHHSVDVPTQRFEDILRTFGIPFYLKIDIEGRDALCLDALQHSPLPKFISAEDAGLDPRSGVPGVLATLHSLGYSRFNLVSQGDFRPLFRRQGNRYKPNLLDRIVKSLAYGRLRVPLVCKLFEPMTNKGALARRNGGREFAYCSSGPWGNGIPGGWVTFEEACRLDAQIRAHYLSNSGADPSEIRSHNLSHSGVNPTAFWCDWHATTEPQSGE